MASRHDLNFFCIIVSHQEITPQCPTCGKQLVVVEVIMSIQTFTRFLSASRIWGVYEINCIRHVAEFSDYVEAVSTTKINSLSNVIDIQNPLSDSCGIPTRVNALAILSVLKKT